MSKDKCKHGGGLAVRGEDKRRKNKSRSGRSGLRRRNKHVVTEDTSEDRRVVVLQRSPLEELPEAIRCKLCNFLSVRDMMALKGCARDWDRVISRCSRLVISERFIYDKANPRFPACLGANLEVLDISHTNLSYEVCRQMLVCNAPTLRRFHFTKCMTPLPNNAWHCLLTSDECEFPRLEEFSHVAFGTKRIGNSENTASPGSEIENSLSPSRICPVRTNPCLRVIALVNMSLSLPVLKNLLETSPVLEAAFLGGCTLDEEGAATRVDITTTAEWIETSFWLPSQAELLQKCVRRKQGLVTFWDFCSLDCKPAATDDCCDTHSNCLVVKNDRRSSFWECISPAIRRGARAALLARDPFFHQTALHRLLRLEGAAQPSSDAYARLILLGASAREMCNLSRTAVFVACQYDRANLLQGLVSASELGWHHLYELMKIKSIRGESAFFCAALMGSHKCLTILCRALKRKLQMVSDPCANKQLQAQILQDHTLQHDNWSPLHAVSMNGNVPAAKAILDTGLFSGLERTKTEQTPFHIACFAGHLPIVELLIEHGMAPLGARDFKGQTGLQIARKGRLATQLGVVALLSTMEPEIADSTTAAQSEAARNRPCASAKEGRRMSRKRKADNSSLPSPTSDP